MGERVSHDGIVAMACHGDMGIMFFSCVEWEKQVVLWIAKCKMICHG